MTALRIRRAYLVTVAILAIVLAGVLFLLPRTRTPTERERTRLMSWLTCTECTEGQREFVRDSLGTAVIPLLESALMGLDTTYRGNIAHGIGAHWALIDSASVDSATYVAHFLSNFDATVQRRAAVALGDLRAVDVLENALRPGNVQRYRADVVAVINESLEHARAVGTNVEATAPAGVRLTPDSVALRAGEARRVVADLLDTAGARSRGAVAVAWSSTDSSVASVVSIDARTASVSGVAVGTAVVLVTARGQVLGRVPVAVDSAAARTMSIAIDSGNYQSGVVNTVLTERLVVRVTDAHGTPVEDVAVAWDVRYGGGVFVPTSLPDATTPTASDGRARIAFRLGSAPGPVAINAKVTGASIRFSLDATIQ